MYNSSFARIKCNHDAHQEAQRCAYKNELDRILSEYLRIKCNCQGLQGQETKGIGQNAYIYYQIKISLHILFPISCEYREQKYVVMLDALTLLVDTLGIGLPTNNVNQYLADSDNFYILNEYINGLNSASQNPCWTPGFGRASPLVKLQNLDDFSIQQFTMRPSLAALDLRGLELRSRLAGPERAATHHSVLVTESSLDATAKPRRSSAAWQLPSTGAAWTSDAVLGNRSLLTRWGVSASRGFRWGENFIRFWTNTNETGARYFDLGIEKPLSAFRTLIPAKVAPGRRYPNIPAHTVGG